MGMEKTHVSLDRLQEKVAGRRLSPTHRLFGLSENHNASRLFDFLKSPNPRHAGRLTPFHELPICWAKPESRSWPNFTNWRIGELS